MLTARTALGTPHGPAAEIRDLVGPGLSVTEHGDLGCVLLSASASPNAVRDRIARSDGLRLPADAGAVVYGDACTAIWLSPHSWLLMCENHDEASLLDRLNGLFGDADAIATAFGDYLCWLELAGDAVGSALAQGGFVSLSSGGFTVGHGKRTVIAGIPVVLERRETDQWLVGIERSRTRYFVDWLRAVRPRGDASE